MPSHRPTVRIKEVSVVERRGWSLSGILVLAGGVGFVATRSISHISPQKFGETSFPTNLAPTSQVGACLGTGQCTRVGDPSREKNTGGCR